MKEIVNRAQADISGAQNLEQLSAVRVKYLGKSGEVTALLKGMKDLSPEERKVRGQEVNEIKQAIEELLSLAVNTCANAELEKRLNEETIDITLPGKPLKQGGLHPITKVYYEIRDIFLSMGFEVNEGPEIEYDEYNFEMLNIPKNHPARDMQDTFYITDNILLRTHTSPVQIRTMLNKKPPIRMICPGRVYRCDDVDATHSPVFHQLEGLVVGENITFADLKGTIDTFLKELYGSSTKTRFRPGFFPFTEPSAEVDATCALCGGKGCGACKGAGVIEVLGCGMVHNNVLANCGIDPNKYTGFAFGLGLDRIANVKYGITDIRLLYENDIRFLRQFK